MFKILKEKKLKRLDQILLYLQEQGIETNISELKMHIDFFKRKQEKRRLLGQAGNVKDKSVVSAKESQRSNEESND